MSAVTGIDVSAYQHPPYQRAGIDWRAVAGAGHAFAIVKATEGVHYTNPHFWSDRHNARQAGLLVGSYHFLRWQPGAPSGAAQARHYRQVVGDTKGELTPACDLEWIKGAKRPAREIVAIAREFVAECEQQFGRWPMIYTGPSFWRWCLLPAGDDALALTSWPLWLVDYHPPIDPMIGAPDWRWSIHQHTGDGSCPGVQGDCDLNVVRDMRTLRELAGLDPDLKGD